MNATLCGPIGIGNDWGSLGTFAREANPYLFRGDSVSDFAPLSAQNVCSRIDPSLPQAVSERFGQNLYLDVRSAGLLSVPLYDRVLASHEQPKSLESFRLGEPLPAPLFFCSHATYRDTTPIAVSLFDKTTLNIRSQPWPTVHGDNHPWSPLFCGIPIKASSYPFSPHPAPFLTSTGCNLAPFQTNCISARQSEAPIALSPLKIEYIVAASNTQQSLIRLYNSFARGDWTVQQWHDSDVSFENVSHELLDFAVTTKHKRISINKFHNEHLAFIPEFRRLAEIAEVAFFAGCLTVVKAQNEIVKLLWKLTPKIIRVVREVSAHFSAKTAHQCEKQKLWPLLMAFKNN